MALFNSFTFGDVDSKDYGVYVSGDSVYDSPARSVDLVQVPGRNGALALDNGYYENIEVTYPAGSFGTSQEEWREKMLGIRNALAAQRGYQRLIDTYHPEHYRLGMFFAGISASPVQYNRAGQFPIRFNCKPQRFLISGDTPVEFTAEGQEEVYGPASIASFEAEEGAEIRQLEVDLEPIQSGSGDPSPSNIRPISGHTEVNVWDDPKHAQRIVDWNQLINDDGTGWLLNRVFVTAAGTKLTFAVTGGSSIKFAYRDVIRGHKYYYSGTFDSSSNYGFAIGIWNGNSGNSYTERHLYSYTGESVRFAHISESVNDNQTFRLQFATAATSTEYSVIENFMLCDLTEIFGAGNEPATVAAFEALFPKDYYPYNAGEHLCVSAVNGDPYTKQTISLGQTVYGGTLDVTTGVLTIDRAMVDLGTLTYSYSSTYGYMVTTGIQNAVKRPAANTDLANIVCSNYATITASQAANGAAVGVGIQTNGRIIIYDSAYTDATTFKTAMNGVQLCYELATPTTVQLTPTEVTTLLGQNNIWADSGEVEVKVASPVDLTNPTNFPAKPLIRVYGNGSVQVGDTIATVQNNADGYVDIDCESMNCYDTTGGRNADVSFSGNDFPELASGDNGILLTGPSRVEITPRWWEL